MPGVTTAYQTGIHAGRPANGTGCILYSCTTHGLVYRDNGTTWTTFLTLPSGSGGGSQVYHHDPDSAPASPSAQDDEFEDASIGGGLTRVAHGTPKGSWAEKYGQLSWYETASFAVGEMDVYAQARTVSIGDYIEASVHRAVKDGNLGVAIGFSNGTVYGTSNAIASYTKFESAISYFLLNSWPGHNSRTNDGTALAMAQYQFIEHFYLRVKYEAANTWGLYVSLDGHRWYAVQTNYSYSLSPTHVIFGVGAHTASAPSWVKFDYVRINA